MRIYSDPEMKVFNISSGSDVLTTSLDNVNNDIYTGDNYNFGSGDSSSSTSEPVLGM